MKHLFPACICVLIILFLSLQLKADQDSVYIKVHFLHGSKPKKEFKKTEDKWFGGILGGHVGVEYEHDKIFNFIPKSRFHLFSNRNLINSAFTTHDSVSFYSLLGANPDSVKRTIIVIKISGAQKIKLDSLVKAYRKRPPYDYAFFGMRCGAAAYDVLAQIGVVYKYNFKKTWRKIFYPRKLRRRLEFYAKEMNFTVIKTEGSKKRIWEKD